MWGSKLAVALSGTLFLAGCGTGGLEYWLYPEPRLEVSNEAVFVAYEDNRVLAIDGQETFILCWGETQGRQAYRQRSTIPCRLHIAPGEHTVVFAPAVTSRDRVSVEFTAVPGRSYGLERTGCRGTVNDALLATCIVNVVEVSGPEEENP